MEHLGNRLLHARTAACLTQADVAAKAGLDVGVSSVSEWEHGVREPSVAQLARLAEIYKRPFDWFLVSEPIAEQSIKWRKKPESAGEIESEFRRLCSYYHELEVLCESRQPCVLPSPVSIQSRRAAELLADSLRNELKLGLRPALLLRSRLEEAYGVKLFCMEFEPSGTAATLCEREGIGVGILLNEKNSIRRLAFDLAHELYHVVASSSDDEERLADSFAAQLLLPSEEFLGTVDARRGQNGKISYSAFLEVIREFGVSVDAAVWRLNSLTEHPARANVEDTIRRLRQAWSASEEKNAPPHPPKLPERYVSLAREALRRGLISTGYYAKCLGISRNRAMVEQSELLEGEGEADL